MKRPLCVFCFTGLLTQMAAVCLPQVVFWPLAAFCVLGGVAWFVLRHSPAPLVPAAAVVAACAFCLLTQTRLVKPARALAGQTVTVTAVVAQTGSSYVDGMVSAVLELHAVNGEELSRPVKARCSCLPDCALGDRFRAELALSALPETSANWGDYADGVFLEAEYLSGFSPRGSEASLRFTLRRFGLQLSANVRRYLRADIGGVLAAMTTGDRRFLTAAQRTLFRKAGISHILVVSGLHVSALCGVIFPKAGTRRRRVLGALLSILLALFMMFLVGFTPSVTRAGAAAILLNLGVLLMRPGDSFTALGVAVFGMSALNAYTVCDLALQLSFAATLGVLCGGEATQKLPRAEWAQSRWGGWAARLLQNTASSAASALFTFPVLVFWGMTVSAVSLLANLCILWLARPMLLCGFGAALCGLVPWLAPLQRGFGLAGGILVRLLLALAEWFAALPGAQLYFETPFAGVVVLVLLVGAAVLLAAKVPKRHIAVVCAVLLCAAGLVGGVFSRDITRVALVGNSWSPSVVITKDGQAAVLYRGGDYNYATVRDYLEQRGILQPDLVVDLRYDATSDCRLAAAQQLALADLDRYTAENFTWNGVAVSLYSSGKGGAVWLDLGSVSAAVVSGDLQTAQPVRADFLLASSANAADVQSSAILTRHLGYLWLDRNPANAVYYGQNELCLVLRTGVSYQIKGA